MNNLKQKAISAIIWDFLGKLSIQGSSFIVSIFLARLLSPSDFGLVAVVLVVLNILNIFMDVGLSSALIQRKKLLDIHYNSVFYFNLFFAIFLTFIVILFSKNIANFYNQSELTLIIQIMSIIFIIRALNSVQRVFFIKKLQYKILAKINFLSSLLGGTIGIILAFKDFGVWSLVFQNIIGSILGTFLIWTHSQWRPKLLFSIKALKQLWSFGFNMFLASLLDRIFSQIDYIIIGKLFNLTTLGYFQRAKSLNGLIIKYSSDSVMQVMFPVLSKIQNDLKRFQNVVIKTLSIIVFLAFFLIGIFYLNAQELIVLVFSEKWLPSVDMFKILALSSFAYPINSLLVNILMSRGNSKDFLRLDIYKKISLSLTFAVGFYFGIEGYLYALVIHSIFAVYINLIYSVKEIKIEKKEPLIIILAQAFISSISIVLVQAFISIFKVKSLAILLTLKILFFIVFYLTLNHLFNLKPYRVIKEEVLKVIYKGKNS